MQTYVKFTCPICSSTFKRPKKRATQLAKNGTTPYCSKRCLNQSRTVPKSYFKCAECGKEVVRKPHEMRNNTNFFCNRSCSVTYNNKNKSKGTRRSKLECWIESQLTSMYPKLDIHFNRKDTIDSELDIYIPKLRLAFELNGIFHYEPIFGSEKLSQIKNNDNRKFQACLEKGIELCILDTSGLKYFKPKSAQKFLDIICQIIESKLSP